MFARGAACGRCLRRSVVVLDRAHVPQAWRTLDRTGPADARMCSPLPVETHHCSLTRFPQGQGSAVAQACLPRRALVRVRVAPGAWRRRKCSVQRNKRAWAQVDAGGCPARGCLAGDCPARRHGDRLEWCPVRSETLLRCGARRVRVGHSRSCASRSPRRAGCLDQYLGSLARYVHSGPCCTKSPIAGVGFAKQTGNGDAEYPTLRGRSVLAAAAVRAQRRTASRGFSRALLRWPVSASSTTVQMQPQHRVRAPQRCSAAFGYCNHGRE